LKATFGKWHTRNIYVVLMKDTFEGAYGTINARRITESFDVVALRHWLLTSAQR